MQANPDVVKTLLHNENLYPGYKAGDTVTYGFRNIDSSQRYLGNNIYPRRLDENRSLF